MPLMKRPRLMAPGPVLVGQSVMKRISESIIHHRTPAFTERLNSALTNLKKVFQTEQACMIHASTGSGAMESALVNTLSPGDEILAVCCGRFGERWAEIAESYGIKVHRLAQEWGTSFDTNNLAKALKSHPNIKALISQACETSTGALHPIKEMAEQMNDHPGIFIVDGITALGAYHIPMDLWNIDVLIGGSQKAFALPTGLSFISLSKKAWKHYEEARCPRFYFDLAPEKRANEKGQTRFSSAGSLIEGLELSLNYLTEMGLHNHFHTIADRAFYFRQAMSELNLDFFPDTPSPSLTVINVPKGIDGIKWRSLIEDKYNITVMGGQEKLKGKIIRIGHMGAQNLNDYLLTISAIGNSLVEMGFELDDKRVKQAELNYKCNWQERESGHG